MIHKDELLRLMLIWEVKKPLTEEDMFDDEPEDDNSHLLGKNLEASPAAFQIAHLPEEEWQDW